MVDVNPLTLGLEVGGGGVLGFLTGYTAKKVVKIVALLIGAQLALFKFLETRGVLEVNWERLYTSAGNATTTAANATVNNGNGGSGRGIFESILSILPVGGGFAVGALVGFKRG
ncbi:MAG: FUN14 domain-containing protein [Halobacteriales archaeon]|nr:FUN14 domain-containing protein [Halobacteriales archaeon]